MAVFNDSELTQTVNKMQARIESQHTMLRQAILSLSSQVWANANHTPQEVLDELGTRAAKVFQLSGAAANLIYLATGEVLEVVPEGYEFTVNVDGTITITAEPVVVGDEYGTDEYGTE